MTQSIINLGKKIVPHDIRIFLRKLNWQRYYWQQNLFKAEADPVYCPIARQEFKSFVKINNDLVTPTNGARARQRLVWHFLENELGLLDKQANLLHVAPELSFFDILNKQENLTYIPGDKMVAGYSNQKGIRNIDLIELEFEDHFFDLILCNHVLEHIPDDKAAMSEMFRVLKTGGVAVITVPIKEDLPETYENPVIISPRERQEHFGQWDHVRYYGLDIKDRLEAAGFTVEMNRYGAGFSEAEFQKFGFCKDIIVVARKL